MRTTDVIVYMYTSGVVASHKHDTPIKLCSFSRDISMSSLSTDSVNLFQANMAELNALASGTSRVHQMLDCIDSFIKNSENSLSVELAENCRLYLMKKEPLSVRDLLEVSYIMNGGILLRGTETGFASNASSVQTQTDSMTQYHVNDEDELEFLRLVGDIDDISLETGTTEVTQDST